MYIKILLAAFFIIFPSLIFGYGKSFLLKRTNLKLVLLISIFLVCIGSVLVFIYREPMFLSMLAPFIFFSNYVILTNWFLKKYKRLPVDTVYNWESGILADRLYNLGVIVIGLCLPFALFALLYDLI